MMHAARPIPLPAARLLTSQQAAAYCGVTVETMKSHIRVAPVRIGKCVRYDVRALDKWLDSQGRDQPQTPDEWLDLLDEDQRARP